jgi:hypothetical protein
MKWLTIAGVLMVAGAAALPTNARADVHVSGGVVITDRDDRGYRGDGRGGSPAFRHGYDRGWREGSDEGNHDGRRNRDPRYWREGEFRDADRGYKGWMGPRWEYVRGFREGYESGYRRAYASSRPAWHDGRDRWGRGGSDGRYDGSYDRYYPDSRNDRYRDDYRR